MNKETVTCFMVTSISMAQEVKHVDFCNITHLHRKPKWPSVMYHADTSAWSAEKNMIDWARRNDRRKKQFERFVIRIPLPHLIVHTVLIDNSLGGNPDEHSTITQRGHRVVGKKARRDKQARTETVNERYTQGTCKQYTEDLRDARCRLLTLMWCGWPLSPIISVRNRDSLSVVHRICQRSSATAISAFPRGVWSDTLKTLL